MRVTNNARGWIPSASSFGARLALVRQHAGFGNTKEAALACGIPVQSWRGWERDGRLPRDLIATCRKIAAGTGCDVAWLAGLELEAGELPDPEPVPITRLAGR